MGEPYGQEDAVAVRFKKKQVWIVAPTPSQTENPLREESMNHIGSFLRGPHDGQKHKVLSKFAEYMTKSLEEKTDKFVWVNTMNNKCELWWVQIRFDWDSKYTYFEEFKKVPNAGSNLLHLRGGRMNSKQHS